MEYGRLQTIKGVNGREPTAFTKKTIKELLAEEGAEAADAELMQSAAPKPAPQPKPQKAAPQPRAEAPKPAAPEPARERFEELAPQASEKPAAKSRSLLGRLIGR